MRSTQIITGALAVAATSALVGLGAAPADARTPGVTHERGVLLECTGTLGSDPVIVNLYENRTHGNFLEVLVGDGPDEAGLNRQFDHRFVNGKKVRAVAKLDGKRLVVAGTAKRTGKVKQVHEVVEDAGERIVSDGTHRMLKPHLTFRLGKRTTPLTCGSAFAYNLTVTKTSIVD